MSAVSGRFLLDTNFVIYLLAGKKEIADFFEKITLGEVYYSFITKIELLSFQGIRSDQEKKIADFLSLLSPVALSQQIEDITIDFRKACLCKLPDAIIASSAIAMQATLLTSDIRLSKLQFPGFQALNPLLPLNV